MGAVLVLVWAHLSRTPWREIGFARPKSWLRTLAAGIAVGIALKLLMKSVVMPLLGADPVNHAYHFLAGNPGRFTIGVGKRLSRRVFGYGNTLP